MNKGSTVNQQAAKKRAESYYPLYASMGRDRFLTKLREHANERAHDTKSETWRSQVVLVVRRPFPLSLLFLILGIRYGIGCGDCILHR
jgi:hypothetical protein